MCFYPKYFTLSEMTHTDTGLNNSLATWLHLKNILNTAFYLDIIRAEYGDAITVDSGYRTPEVNERINGSKTSEHMLGNAADLKCNDIKKLISVIDSIMANKALPIDQLIIHTTFVHVGFASVNPRFQRMVK